MKKAPIAFLLLIAGTALPAEKMSLSIEEAVAIALDKSKALHASLMNVQYAEARSSEVNASRFLSLKLGGSYSRLSDVPPFEIGPFPPLIPSAVTVSPTVLNSYIVRATVQQPLFTGFRLDAAADVAGYTAEAATQDYARDKTELIFTVKNAYWSLFKAQRFEIYFGELVDQIQAHLTDVRNMFDQGLVTKNEVLKVQVQLSNAQLMHIDAKNNVKLARINLNYMMGIPLDSEHELVTDVARTEKELPRLETLVETALAERSEIKAIMLRVQAGEAAVTSARGSWYPQVYLVGNYYYARPNQRFLPTQDVFKDSWDVGVSVSLDVWNWGATIHQTSQAKAQLERAKDGYEQLKDGITLEVTQTYLSLQQADEKIGVAGQAVTQAEENFRVTSDKFKAGLALNSDVLDADTALLQARTLYTQALVDYQLAEAKLKKTIGKL
jgi:outer membrane protein